MKWFPSGRILPERHVARFQAVVASATDAADMFRPLVDRLAVPPDTQDEQLAVMGRERRDPVDEARLAAACFG